MFILKKLSVSIPLQNSPPSLHIASLTEVGYGTRSHPVFESILILFNIPWESFSRGKYFQKKKQLKNVHNICALVTLQSVKFIE